MDNSNIIYITSILSIIILIVAYYRIFEKAGFLGWYAFVPIYNGYILFTIAGFGSAYFLFIGIIFGLGILKLLIALMIPQVGLVFGLISLFFSSIIWIVVISELAKYFSKEKWFVVGMILLPFIFLPVLAFDDSVYTNDNTITPKTIL